MLEKYRGAFASPFVLTTNRLGRSINCNGFA